MMEVFKKHLEKFIAIDDKEFSEIQKFFRIRNYKKKENLMVQGEICKLHFFVLEGCLRKFFINSKGVEMTTEFAIENWWLTDNMAYEHKTETEFCIQAVEPSKVLTIDSLSQEKLLQQFPRMERYFRFIYQRAFAAAQMKLKYNYDLSREEMYYFFLEEHPDFVQRIPQYLLASFLGFTPEYLSEIRAKKRS